MKPKRAGRHFGSAPRGWRKLISVYAPKANAVAVNEKPRSVITIAGVEIALTFAEKNLAVDTATVAVPLTVTPVPPARVSVPVP